MKKSKTVCHVLALLVLMLYPGLACALPGDLDGSGRVDGYDLILFGRAYGSQSGDANWNSEADLNGDGKVDDTDLSLLSAQFGSTGLSFGLWVGDQTSGTERMRKFSNKGNQLLRVGDFTTPGSISSNVTTGEVWVADQGLDKVKKLDPFNGQTLLTVNGIDAYSISVNSKDGAVWVADYNNNRVIKLLPTVFDGYTIGTHTGSHLTVTGFNRPRSVSVDPERGVIWVADTNNNRVVRLSPDVSDGYNIGTDTGKHVVKTGFSSPYAVSANSSDGTLWVADYGNNAVVKLSATGTTEIYRLGEFNHPFALNVNFIDGSVWIADMGNDRVVRLASDGAILAKVTGFNDPYSISVNPIDGNCWVADYSNNQVVKLSPSGAELLRVSGFYRPMALSVTPDAVSDLKYPTAQASLSSNAVDVGETITFTGTGADPDGTIVLYQWDFDGDGTFDYSSATSGITTHAYANVGIYNPVFRVTDNDGLMATDYTQVIRVGRLTAIAGSDQTSGNAPLTVHFTAGFIDPTDGFIDSYQWDFDGDNIFDYFSETTGSTSHTYSTAGTYQATLKIVDGPFTATDTITITVSPSPPTATASATPTSGIQPLNVNFTGSGSDPDGMIVLYEWDLEGDGTFEWFSVSSGNATATYTSPGLYRAKFRVTDNDGLTDTKEVSVTVGQSPPVAVANAVPTRGHPPLPVNFNATGSNDPGGSLVLYEWNFEGECTNLTVFSDDMESGPGNWTVNQPSWALITSDSHSPTHALTESPDGNYPNNANFALSSKTIDLSGHPSGSLSFWHRYETEQGYDLARVEISTNGGSSWTEIASYSGSQPSWTQAQIDISSFLPSNNVKIRFRLTSDSSITFDGWYVDDVAITVCNLMWTSSANGVASYTYTSVGNYTATLRVTDNDGNKAMATVGISVIPLTEPLASASATPTTGTAPLGVTFTGTGVDPQKSDGTEGGITNYHWNFGEEYVWVADASNNQVVRLYQDGSGEVVRKGGFHNPYSVSVNPADGTVWIADYSNNQVVRLSADGRTELVRVGGFHRPTSVSVNPTDGTVWVADYYNSQVVKLKPDGSGELVRKGGFNYPFSVSVNPTDGSVWVADYSNNQVVKLWADGTELVRVSGFSNPVSVSVNPTDGSVWVADYSNNRVVKLLSSVPNGYNIGTDTGSHVILPGFNRPYSVSVDSSDGTCWVADYYNHKVVKVKADGSEKLVNVGGFYYPTSVSVNSTTGVVWVAEYYNNQVVKLDPNGTELARLSGFSYPRAVAVVDTGPGNYFSSASTGNTAHTYLAPGIYKAIFTVTDSDGNKDTATLGIRVYAIPSVTAGANITTGSAPLEVFLYGSATDLDGTIVKYEWDFNGDGTYDWSSSTTATVRHVYSTAAAYTARLRVTDMDGYTNTATVTITVNASAPTAKAGAAPIKGNAPLLVNLFGSGTDPDGTITQYAWDVTNDGTYDYLTATATHTYSTPGAYTAKLRVTDNSGLTATDTVQIQVNPAGTPSALMYAEPTQGVNPLTVRFCGHGIDPDGTIASYEWDFGAGGGWTTPTATPPTAFGDKMEDGMNGWVADAPWARTYADSYSPSYSWTDSPGENYGNDVNAALTSKTIDLTGTLSPRLIFWHKYDLRSGDYGRVEVSGNNGSTWSELGNFSNGTLSAWTKQEYSLSGYKGNPTVKIRFRITSDASGTGDGWYIDDVWVGDCVTNTYPNQGQYTARLRVTDNSAKQDVATEKITVFANQNVSFVWVADYNNSRVVKLSDDGSVLARISGFYYPREVKVDPTNGDVWVADTSNNRVVKLAGNVPDGYSTAVALVTPDSSSSGATGWVFGNGTSGAGRLNEGISLDGNGDYVLIPRYSDLDVQSFTVEAWIKPNSTSGSPTIFMRGNNSGGNELYFGLSNNTTIEAYLDGTQKTFTKSPSVNFVDGNWHHVALVYDAAASQLSCYADGAAYGSPVSISKTLDFGLSHALIGADFDSFNGSLGNYFNGLIDDVRVWNVARSAAEISANKDSELNGSETGLVGYWKLNSTLPPYHQISTGFNQPFYIDVDRTDHGVWVTDRSNSKVVKLAQDGTETLRLSGFSYPRRVAVYQADRSVWVTSEGQNQVVKLNSSGTELLRIGGFYNPIGVAVDQADGSVWVADFNNRVVKLSSTGTVLYSIGGFNRTVTVAVNPNDRSVWVTDHYNHEVVKLSSTGTELLRIGAFNYPHDLDVNPKDGTVWVSDHYNHRMVKLAPDGTELLRMSGFNYPIGVSVDDASRNLTSPPIATSTATPTSGDAPLIVAFTGSGTGTIVRYEWDFDGNGTFDYDSASTGNTTYTYTQPGTYNPIFRVTNNAGMMDYDAPHTIYVGPVTVFATASPATGNAPLNVTFNGYVRGLGSGRAVVKYEWDFEGDGIFDWNNTSSPKTTKNYTRGGTYAAVLRVTDNLGNQAYGSVTVVVNKVGPTATNNATPTSGPVPLLVTLNGSGSDADGSIVLYEWDYDGDGVYDWFSTSAGNTFFTYTAVGIYTATLRVTDNDGLTATASRTITVTNRQDPPSATASADVTEGPVPLTVNFTGTGNDPDDGQIVLYEWDFDGDGTYDWSSTTTGNTSYTYSTAGQYNATLRVKDLDNLTATASVLITVKVAGAPKAVANAAPKSGDAPLTVNFSATGSYDPDGTIVLYEWSFGDEIVWVPDYSNNQVVRVEGYFDEKRLSGFYNPYRISVNPNDGTVWVTDHANDKVVKLKADGTGEIVRVSGFDGPWGISVNPVDGSVWVSSWYQNQVVKLSSTGSELVRKSGFNHPAGVEVDSARNVVWVADYDKNEVARLSATNGTELARITGFNRPIWISVDPNDGSAWVADRYNNRVVKLAANTPDGYNTGVVNITPDASPSGLTGFVFGNGTSGTGMFSGAVSLDGNGDYVLIPRHSALDVQSFTVEAWIKPTSTSGSPTIFMRGNNSGQNELYFGLSNNTTIDVYLDNTQKTFTKTPSISFVDGNWHHVALVYDAAAGQVSCYVDGAAYGTPWSVTKTLDFGQSHALIGADFDSFNGSLGNYFNGLIDEVRIWNVPRSLSEIVATKDAELTGSESGLVGYWKMNSFTPTPYHRSLAAGFSEPICTAVNPIDGSVWVCDQNNDALVKVAADASRAILRVTGFDYPHQAAVNPADGTVWTVSYYGNILAKLSPDGREIFRKAGFSHPTSVAIYNPPSNRFSSTTSGDTTRVYNRTGEFAATLKVTDDSGLSDTDSVTIRSGRFPESIPRAYPTSGDAPLTVRFVSDGRSPEGTIVAYYWDFDGNGVIDNGSFWDYSMPLTYSYTYQTPGVYQATQRVVDNRGLSDTKSITITVTTPSGAPTAKAMADPVEGNAPLLVTFTGLGSDSDGLIKEFAWDFDGDGTYEFISNTTGVTPHLYSTPGIYTARLRVKDNDNNMGTDTVRIEVKPAGSPTAIAGASPTTGFATLKVDFTGSGTDNGTIVKYEWDFDGDGTYDWSSTATGNTFHNYTAPGVYNATLRVTDNDGLTDTAVVKISVATGLTANLSTDVFDPTVGQTVQINTTITGSATITIKIKDRVGNLVRTLVNNVLRSPGYYSDAWDGKNDGGQVVESGVYYYIIDYTVGGQTYIYDVTNDVDPQRYAPSVVYPENFNPFSSETNFFRYTIPYKSEVTVNMSHWNWGGYWGAGPRVKTLLLRKPQKAGSYVMVWDGTDDLGNLVEPGEYLISVWGWRLAADAIIVSKEPLISDLLVTPTYLNPAAQPYDEQNQAVFSYTLSKTADVVATFYDSNNYIVKTITQNGVPAGTGNTLLWDGKNGSGIYVVPGIYRVKLIATDPLGNRSMDANALIVIFY